MSHEIYTTEGFILDSFDVGEADKFFRIFTRELGLVEAVAQGVRKIESKNRYGLQDFSVSNFSLVQGREVWRITNVAPIENSYFIFYNSKSTVKDKEKFNSIINIFSLLKKLIHGEEKNEELFDLVFEAIDFLKNNDLDKNGLENFDIIVSIKILNNLGYFDKRSQKDIFANFLNTPITKFLISDIDSLKEKAKKLIEEVLEGSHL